MTEQITIDAVIEAYVRTRDAIAAAKKTYEETESQLKALQERRELWLAEQLVATGQTSAATPHGTCFFSMKESATVADWDQLLDYIRENDAYELLERRVNKTAVTEIMGEKRANQPPPGVNYFAQRTINVRRSK